MLTITRIAFSVVVLLLLSFQKINSYLIRNKLNSNYKIALFNLLLFLIFNLFGFIFGAIWGPSHGYMWLIGILFIFPASAISGILSFFIIVAFIIIRGKVYSNIPIEINDNIYLERITPKLNTDEEKAFKSVYSYSAKDNKYCLNFISDK
jgi:hypothetical protein